MTRFPHVRLLLSIALLISTNVRAAQAVPELAEISELFDAWRAPNAPGGAVVVVRDGKVAHRECIGLADVDTKRPITPKTPIYVGSVAKQFTASCIFDLVAREKLRLDDSVRSHLPDLHRFSPEPTVQDLIDHRSGIRDFYEAGVLAGWDLAKLPPQSTVLKLIYRQRTLGFPPGSDFCYSNSGYALLAEIVARVSGKNLNEYARERIFEPLGMENARFRTSSTQAVAGAAVGHRRGRNGFRRLPVTSGLFGAGGLYLSIDDVAGWMRHMQGPDRDRGYLAAIRKPRPLASAQRRSPLVGRYAGGLMVGSHLDQPTLHHGGDFPGHRAHVQHYPSLRLSVAILANRQDGPAPASLAKRIAAVVTGTRAEQSPKRALRQTKSTVRPGAYFFRSTESESVVMLGIAARQATFKSMPFDLQLQPTGPTSFASVGTETRADIRVRTTDGRVASLELDIPGTATQTFAAFGIRRPEAEDLQTIVGTYRSDELPAELRLELANGRLRVANRLAIPLRPFNSVTRDLHFTEPRMMLRVIRDDAGRVQGVRISTRRARDLRFVRVAK